MTINPAIRVQNVSKRFVVNETHPTLRQQAKELIRRMFNSSSPASWESEPFWALRHISFDVAFGEAVAVVGSNGSGKTTLLRLLSGISAPTEGIIDVNGQFTALIGLGAGFDLERTGLQNIYLNTAIYGYTAKQTEEVLDSIIAFSELEAYLSMPVKRYSSGMISRLGFSIASHIMSDIVFLDEILAVGDADFQEKSRARIMNLVQDGRTLMLVSHNRENVVELCTRAIWLDRGEVMMDGDAETVLAQYYAEKTRVRPSRS